VDECRPGSRRPTVLAGVPIGHVEGLLLPHLETRQRFTEACREPEVTEEVGQPTAGGNDDAITFDGLPIAEMTRKPLAERRATSATGQSVSTRARPVARARSSMVSTVVWASMTPASGCHRTSVPKVNWGHRTAAGVASRISCSTPTA